MNISSNVPLANNFVLSDGKVLKNIKDLITVLKKMPDDVFSHHVTQDFNHFANWIHDVYDNPSLANKISSTTDKSLIINYLTSALKPVAITQPAKPVVVKKPVTVKKKSSLKKPKKKSVKAKKSVKTKKSAVKKKSVSKKSNTDVFDQIIGQLHELENSHIDVEDLAGGFFKTMWNDFRTFFSKDTFSIVVQDVKSLVPKKK